MKPEFGACVFVKGIPVQLISVESRRGRLEKWKAKLLFVEPKIVTVTVDVDQDLNPLHTQRAA